jgi:hypothetical protein
MELQHLKDIAAKLKFEHHRNIGAEKLDKQLTEHCVELGTTLEEVSALVLQEQNGSDSKEDPRKDTNSAPTDTEENTAPTHSTVDEDFIKKLSKMTFAAVEGATNKQNSIQRLKEANKLVRCMITCNNKNKTSYQGEIFSVRNAKIPEIKKFVPFGVPTHIPQILYNVIKEKQYQSFRKEKVNGNQITRSHIMPEYNIQLLPPLSRDELEAIKQKQLAEGFTGE